MATATSSTLLLELKSLQMISDFLHKPHTQTLTLRPCWLMRQDHREMSAKTNYPVIPVRLCHGLTQGYQLLPKEQNNFQTCVLPRLPEYPTGSGITFHQPQQSSSLPLICRLCRIQINAILITLNQSPIVGSQVIEAHLVSLHPHLAHNLKSHFQLMLTLPRYQLTVTC